MRRWTVEPGALDLAELALSPEASKHARRVLRLQDGETVELRDGAGGAAEARLTDGGRRFAIERRRPARVRSSLQIILAQAVAKADKMDEVVRSAAELGVARLRPFVSERTVPRKEKAVARWRRLAEDALRVSGRWFRMEVDDVVLLDDLLGEPRQFGLVAVPGGGLSVPELLQASPPPETSLVIGPEGGFSPAELERLENGGFRSLDLGEAILRTQTAGHALVAALTLGWGLTETE
ncbi:MAG: RsmE family RNA methyltransferase [Myxococcota bacterium]